MLRITGGQLGGRVLKKAIPAGVRPTAAKTREAVFSMIGQDLSGWSMLDMFGGSGMMALEAASRGASPVVVVEKNHATARFLREALAELTQNSSARIRLLEGDSLKLPLQPADLVFSDPPYADSLEQWLPAAARLTRRVLVAEARTKTIWPEQITGLSGMLLLDRVRNYGEASIGIYLTQDTGNGLAASTTTPGTTE